jgi:hypothetical protein
MRVVALEKFEYANQLRLAGDEFDTTSEKDAEILVLAKKVKQAPALAETRAMKAEEQPPMNTDNGSALTPPKQNKKRYMRRDMRAEE